MSSVLLQRNVFGFDTARTRLTQNLRGALDVMGADIRIAGENLSSRFPVVEVVDGGSGTAPDTLTVRRNLLGETDVLTLCENITAGSSGSWFNITDTGAPPPKGCILGEEQPHYEVFNTYRLRKGGSVDAFILDPVQKVGEFFTLSGQRNSSGRLQLLRGGGSWSRSYNRLQANIFIIEEWQYRIRSQVLEIVQNGVDGSPYRVAPDVMNFQVRVLMQDGTTMNNFGPTDEWAKLRALALEITGTDRFRKRELRRSLSASFFPRNVMSQ
jgi:type IV pilus assembly protein PilW